MIGCPVGETWVEGCAVGENVGVGVVSGNAVGENVGVGVVSGNAVGENVGVGVVSGNAVGENVGVGVVSGNAVGENVGVGKVAGCLGVTGCSRGVTIERECGIKTGGNFLGGNSANPLGTNRLDVTVVKTVRLTTGKGFTGNDLFE